jgi:fructokinase
VDDVLVVGEALVDIVRRADGRTAEHPGGSPANVALGLGRLGRVVSLLSRFGLDARGTSIAVRLAASNVVVVPGTRTTAPTSTATAVLDEHGAATYTFELDWRLPPAEELDRQVTGARALHTGSLATFLAPGGDAVLDLVRSAAGRTTVSFDPNARPGLMGDPAAARERVEQFVRATDVVKVSDEDLGWLAPGEDPAAVAAGWLALGPSVLVVTRGGAGATGLAAAGRVDVESPPVQVVDTVGAGDAFTAGLLDALAAADLLGVERAEQLRAISTGSLAAALRHAARVAAVTCSRPGADPPTRAELVAAYPEDATDRMT